MASRAVGVVLSMIVAVSCADSAPTIVTDPPTTVTTTTTRAPSGAVASFETPDGARYRVVLEGEHLERARRALAAGHSAGIPNGRLLPGDGGVNIGYEWHVVDVELVDMATEVCDATVSYVEDLGYEAFVAQHGPRFCPWGAVLLSVE